MPDAVAKESQMIFLQYAVVAACLKFSNHFAISTPQLTPLGCFGGSVWLSRSGQVPVKMPEQFPYPLPVKDV